MGYLYRDRYMSTDYENKYSEATQKCRFIYEGFGYWPLTKMLRLGEQWGWIITKCPNGTHGQIYSRLFHTQLQMEMDADIHSAENIEVELDGKRYGKSVDHCFIYAWHPETFFRNQSPSKTVNFQLLVYAQIDVLDSILRNYREPKEKPSLIEWTKGVQVLGTDVIHMVHK